MSPRVLLKAIIPLFVKPFNCIDKIVKQTRKRIILNNNKSNAHQDCNTNGLNKLNKHAIMTWVSKGKLLFINTAPSQHSIFDICNKNL